MVLVVDVGVVVLSSGPDISVVIAWAIMLSVRLNVIFMSVAVISVGLDFVVMSVDIVSVDIDENLVYNFLF